MKFTPNQDACLTVLIGETMPLRADQIGWKMSPRLKGVAVSSVLRSLERKLIVVRIPPPDRWSCARWSLSPGGRKLLERRAEEGNP